MAIQLQLRQGTSAENQAFVGAVGEPVWTTDTNSLFVHDGTTAGGIPAARFAMPSSSIIDLTLGATGASYTAPADGWVYFGKVGGAAGQYIQINAGSLISFQSANDVNKYMRIYIPVKKGGFSVSYDASGSTLGFRFIYAEGAR